VAGIGHPVEVPGLERIRVHGDPVCQGG
jgi:hypothetical protein